MLDNRGGLVSIDVRRPYEWGSVVVWTLSLFLFGFANTRSPQVSAVDRVVGGVMLGLMLAVVGGAIVAIYKYYKPSPIPNSTDALASARANDMAVFVISLVLVAMLVWKAIALQTYGAFIDAFLLTGLGYAVKLRIAPARWMMAVYAFITPFIVIAGGGGGEAAWAWPFIFYAACRSMLLHEYIANANKLNADAVSVEGATSHKKGTVQSTQNLSPDELYEVALEEIENGQTVKGTWARAFAEANGEENRAKANYINLRVQQLREEKTRVVSPVAKEAEPDNRLEHNKRNGQGTFTSADGSKYVGEFGDGKENGQGTQTWPDGAKYVGEYRDGKFNGQGIFTFANGKKYVGEFRDGGGRGNEYAADGTFLRSGTWDEKGVFVSGR